MRILLVTTRSPLPPWRGNQLRTLRWAADLAERHEVTVLAPAPPRGHTIPADLAWRWRVYRRRPVERVLGLAAALFSRRASRPMQPLQNGLYRSADLRRQFERQGAAGATDLVILQLARLEGLLAGRDARVPLAVDLVDCLSLNLERRASRDHALLRPLLRAEAARLLEAERELTRASRATWLVCERDRRHLEDRLGETLGARLAVVPLSVEAPSSAPSLSAASMRGPRFALTGNLGYFPTDDGARWFLRQVWPRLRARWPGASLVLAGARPSASLRRAAAQAGAVLDVAPPDVAAVLRATDVSIAPLFAGSGVPIKVLEAWAAGRPVVATRWAAAGVDGVDGEDLLAADEPEEWVRAIERLSNEPGLGTRLVAAGLARLRRDYSPDVVKRTLWREVERVVASSR